MEYFEHINIDKIKIPPISSSFYKNSNYTLSRINKIILFYKFLCRHIKFNKLDKRKQHKIIKTLERVCYHHTLHKARIYDIINKWSNDTFDNLYHFICGRVIAYLNYEETNPDDVHKFIIKIINKYDYMKKFPILEYKDLYPEIYENTHKRHLAGEQKKIKYSKMYSCPKCKKKLSTIANRYNRSLDEGVNLMITCVYCGFERPG